MALYLGFACFAIAISAVIIALVYKPKRSQKNRRLPNNLSKAKNYDRGMGVRKEEIKQTILEGKPVRESKVEQARRLDILHQQFRGNKSTAVSSKKPDISIAKLRKLTKMVNGEDAVARRLIEGNLKLFPDMNPDWACDKAISDLERDRQ